MDDHLGYEKSQRSDSDDYRNGYKTKRVNSSYGAMDFHRRRLPINKQAFLPVGRFITFLGRLMQSAAYLLGKMV